MFRRLPAGFLASLLIILLLVSCSPKKHPGGALRIGIFHEPTEINPLSTDSSISANLLDLLFSTLIRITPQGEIRPEIAGHWEISPDRLTWTFFLRKDVFFHDGTLLDAEDVAWTYKTLLKSNHGGLAYTLKYLKEIETIDRFTLRLRLSRPDNVLWAGLNIFGIVPKNLMTNDPEYRNFDKHPVGSGAFLFSQRNEEEIILSRNPSYFGEKPCLDHIVIRMLPSQTATINHLVAGNIDMIFLHNSEDYGVLKRLPEIRIYKNWPPLLHFLGFNLQNDILKSSLTRRALNLAINKRPILDRALQGQGRLASGTIPENSPFFDPSIPSDEYQPVQALELLKKDGWIMDKNKSLLMKDRKPFVFTALGFEGEVVSETALRMIQHQLREIGVRMNLRILPFHEWARKCFRQRDFDASMLMAVFRPLTDNNFNFWHSSQKEAGLNFSSYTNLRIDRWLEEARLSPDETNRARAFREFQKELHEDPPGIFLFWKDIPIAIHKRFRGIPEQNMESLTDLVHVWEDGSHQDWFGTDSGLDPTVP